MASSPNPVVDGVAVSAPGKVLLAGGYLVLDRQYTGLVFGLNARIHVHVQRSSSSDIPNHTLVRSPQFKDAVWVYYDRPLDVQGAHGGILVAQE
jgi:phosphomevalonate kinase